VLIEQFNGQAEYPALMKLLTAEHAGDLDSQRAELMAAIEKLNAKALDVQVADLKAGLAAGTLDESGRTQLRALLARSAR
jgi:hypothetical protein